MGFFTKNESTFPWKKLTSTAELETLWEQEVPFLIFKHSTRCSISSMALNQFEQAWDLNNPVEIYYLDLLNHRDVSVKIEEITGVVHQSPQAILIRNKTVLYHNSHHAIDASAIKSTL